LAAAGVLFTIATIATAQSAPPIITPHVVIGGPAGRFVVDIEVTIDPNDAWTAGGVAGEALNGASLVYAIDPNTGRPIATAPDTGIGGRFVTFVSKPLGQFEDRRFRNGGSAGIAGGFDGPPALEPNSVGLAFLEFPPTGTLGSGFNTRIALELSDAIPDDPTLSFDEPDRFLAHILLADATSVFSHPLTTLEFWVVPEPASLALLLLGGVLAFPIVARRGGRGG